MIKALIVDDDHLVRKGFIAMMPWQTHCIEVVGEAGNGRKALEFLAEHEVDLLITDLAMPVMSGIDLMREVKKRYPQVSVVVLTFHQDFEWIQEALRLGALDYITKVELEEERLEEVLRRVVERFRERKVPAAGPAIEPKTDKVEKRPTASTVSLKSLHELGERWAAPDWMMEDNAFRRLALDTRRMALSGPQLEQLFFIAVDRWKRLFGDGFPPQVPDRRFEIWEDWVRWLERVRASYRDYSEPSDYAPEVKASVWKAVEIIQQELEKGLPLPEIARRVHMSRATSVVASGISSASPSTTMSERPG
ncbi:response regulator [Paenibacillus sp. P26]|nr:response regulator [Paenibacillus sp. P26]